MRPILASELDDIFDDEDIIELENDIIHDNKVLLTEKDITMTIISNSLYFSIYKDEFTKRVVLAAENVYRINTGNNYNFLISNSLYDKSKKYIEIVSFRNKEVLIQLEVLEVLECPFYINKLCFSDEDPIELKCNILYSGENKIFNYEDEIVEVYLY